jgi:hypothetical protein
VIIFGKLTHMIEKLINNIENGDIEFYRIITKWECVCIYMYIYIYK